MKSRHDQAEAGARARGGLAHAGVATLPKLTSLRFFAAFWVLGFHALPRAGIPNRWDAFWNLGWLGVTFFFVLSGFILTYTYGREGGHVDRRQFWFARLARVYPLYLFALLFAVPQFVHDVRLVSGGVDAISTQRVAGAVVSSITMVQAWFGQFVCLWNCPSWSLSDEAFFYALFPLVVPLVASRRGRTVILASTLGGMAAVTWATSSAATPEMAARVSDASLNPLVRLPEFMLGVWLGGLFLANKPSWKFAAPAATVAALTAIAFAIFAGKYHTGGAPHLIAAPIFALLIFSVAASRHPDRGMLAAAPLVLLGEASYALYMLHGPLHGYMLAAFNRATPAMSYGMRFVVYAAVAILMGIASFIWLERPARRRLRAWFDRTLPAVDRPQ